MQMAKVYTGGLSTLAVSVGALALLVFRLRQYTSGHDITQRFENAAICGKFYPPHAGHSHMIETALNMSKSVYVIICWKKDERPTGEERAKWLKIIHPEAIIISKEDIYNDNANSKLWADLTKSWTGITPDAVFTSEAYGDEWARQISDKTVHINVDPKRDSFSISGSAIRANPYANFHFLHPIVARYYSKVVCIVGAESTGKSVLSNRLAMKFFGSALVLEYGREVTERNLRDRQVVDTTAEYQTPEWRDEDFVEIARTQTEMISEGRESSPLVIADTDALATSIWNERYMGAANSEVMGIVQQAIEPDLYLLCSTEGVPFVQDGTRDGEAEKREWMERKFRTVLQNKSNVVTLKGNFEQRYLQAIKEIESKFPQLASTFT